MEGGGGSIVVRPDQRTQISGLSHHAHRSGACSALRHLQGLLRATHAHQRDHAGERVDHRRPLPAPCPPRTRARCRLADTRGAGPLCVIASEAVGPDAPVLLRRRVNHVVTIHPEAVRLAVRRCVVLVAAVQRQRHGEDEDGQADNQPETAVRRTPAARAVPALQVAEEETRRKHADAPADASEPKGLLTVHILSDLILDRHNRGTSGPVHRRSVHRLSHHGLSVHRLPLRHLLVPALVQGGRRLVAVPRLSLLLLLLLRGLELRRLRDEGGCLLRGDAVRVELHARLVVRRRGPLPTGVVGLPLQVDVAGDGLELLAHLLQLLHALQRVREVKADGVRVHLQLDTRAVVQRDLLHNRVSVDTAAPHKLAVSARLHDAEGRGGAGGVDDGDGLVGGRAGKVRHALLLQRRHGDGRCGGGAGGSGSGGAGALRGRRCRDVRGRRAQARRLQARLRLRLRADGHRRGAVRVVRRRLRGDRLRLRLRLLLLLRLRLLGHQRLRLHRRRRRVVVRRRHLHGRGGGGGGGGGGGSGGGGGLGLGLGLHRRRLVLARARVDVRVLAGGPPRAVAGLRVEVGAL
eukprot:Rhum_TRINITY_DN14689_c27_g1::Rhum_TRINITY_DN14689_c27_g1_i1::g.109922::m.109922